MLVKLPHFNQQGIRVTTGTVIREVVGTGYFRNFDFKIDSISSRINFAIRTSFTRNFTTIRVVRINFIAKTIGFRSQVIKTFVIIATEAIIIAIKSVAMINFIVNLRVYCFSRGTTLEEDYFIIIIRKNLTIR